MSGLDDLVIVLNYLIEQNLLPTGTSLPTGVQAALERLQQRQADHVLFDDDSGGE